MMAENDILRLYVAVDDLELVHQSQLLFEAENLITVDALERTSFLEGKLDAIVVDNNVKAQIVFDIRRTLKRRAYFKD